MEPVRSDEPARAGAEVVRGGAGPVPVAFVPRKRRRSYTWLVLALVAGAGVGSWWWFIGRKAGDKARVYVTAKVDRGTVEEGISATGTLQAVETVQVGALVSGRVMELRADENQEVKAGMVIAVIDPEPYVARVEQARAQWQVANAAVERAAVDRRRVERERDRAVQLGSQGALGDAEVDTAESAVEMARASEKSAAAEAARARAALKTAQLDLDRTTIVSPIDGLVLARPVEVGQSVQSGFQTPTLFTIARDLGEMEVRASIDEADIGKVKEGMDAKFSVDAYPGEEFKGTIAQLRKSPTVTQNVVTYEALIRVKNDDKRLWPGMTATVRVVTARKDDVLRVPNAAMRFKAPKDLEGKEQKTAKAPSSAKAEEPAKKKRDRGGKSRKIWRLVNGKPEAVEVQVGIADEQYTELTGGDLKEGDELVTEIQGEAGAKPTQPSGGSGQRGPRGPRF